MSVTVLIQRLNSLAIDLTLDDGNNLRIRGNKKALTPQLLGSIKDNKSALVSHLRGENKLYPTSFAQHRFWLIDQMLPGSTHYNLPLVLPLPQPFMVEAAQRAFECIIKRHEVLRTVFVKNGADSGQKVLPDIGFKLACVDLSGLADRQSRFEQLVADNAGFCFDLAKGPLFKASFVQMGDQDAALLVNLHHIIADQWSLDILMQEFSVLYQAFAMGKPNPLSALATQYGDYAKWQRQQLFDGQLDYWRGKLKDLSVCHGLGLKQARPAFQTFNGATHHVRLDEALSAKVRAAASTYKLTHFMLFNGLFALTLARYSDSNDIVVGVPVNTRSQKQYEGLVGPFLNSYILRFDCEPKQSVSEFMTLVRTVNLEAMNHQTLPFEALVDDLNPPRSAAHSPLFQIMVNQNTPDAGQSLPDDSQPVQTKYDLTLNISASSSRQGGGFTLNFEYNTDLFSKSFINSLSDSFNQLMNDAFDQPQQQVGRLKLMSEQSGVIVNGEPADYVLERNLIELLDNQCLRTPDIVALDCADQQLSYAQLAQRSNQFAHYLVAQGVVKGDLVAVLLPPGIEMIATLLGIIKAGGAYVPLSKQFPVQRLAEIVADGDIKHVITESAKVTLFDSPTVAGLSAIAIDDSQILQNIENCPQTALAEVQITPDDLAYVIYTSGSTGKPKGVMLPHGAVVNFIHAMLQKIEATPGKRWLLQTAISFDIAFLEWFGCLAAGSTCVIAREQEVEDAFLLRAVIEQQNIDLVQATPSRFKQLVSAGFKGHKDLTLLSGGEPLDSHLQKVLHHNNKVLWNCYGPTEATIWSLVRKVTEADINNDKVPLGGSLANYQHVVVDASGELVPTGVAGELGICGSSLATGYLKRDDLTTQRFVDLVLGGVSKRVYLTGDLVRLTVEGEFDYLGRMDDQVKINGHRIELQEIERQLLQQPKVKNASVCCNTHYLMAFIQLDEADMADEVAIKQQVMSQIGGALPTYMMPKTITAVSEFALNPNGKIDKQALAKAEVTLEEVEYVAPQSDGETTIAKVWQQVLKKDRVGITDNFFAVGGDSLLMVDLAAQLNELGIEVSIKQLLENQTITSLLQSIANRSTLSDTDMVVKLNNNTGEQTPLFFAHPLTGSVYDLKSLGEALEPTLPVYAIQAPFLANVILAFSSLRELAQHYFAEVQKIQPKGPYRFGGTSAGVQIAYQLAQIAVEAGEQVTALVSLDSLPFGLYDDITSSIDAIGLTADLVISAEQKAQLLQSCDGQDERTQRQLLVDKIKDSGQANYFNGVSIATFVEFLQSYFIADSPKGPLNISGPTLHFATGQNPNKQRMLDSWQAVVQGQLEVRDLPGDHDALTASDNVTTMAGHIAELVVAIDNNN